MGLPVAALFFDGFPGSMDSLSECLFFSISQVFACHEFTGVRETAQPTDLLTSAGLPVNPSENKKKSWKASILNSNSIFGPAECGGAKKIDTQ